MKKKEIKSNDFQREIRIRKKSIHNSLNRVINSGWFILGPEVKSFEQEFSEYLGSEHCIGVGNGLEALQISLMALDVGIKDEVITTPLSAMATTLSIIAVGAKPVFCDVDDRGQLDTSKIPRLITPKTKAILPVDLYGFACNPEKILDISNYYNIAYIEDACQAHGSIYKNKKLGTYGKISAFSFYPTKNLGAYGDGGAIVTSDDSLQKKCRLIRDYGQSGKYVHSTYGLNSRLDEIQAAILREKLKHLDVDNRKRVELAEIYTKILRGCEGLDVIPSIVDETPNFHQFVIKISDRERLQVYLKQRGIGTLVHYPLPIPDQPLFKGKFREDNLTMARDMCNKALSLPIYPYLKKQEVTFIARTIKDFYKKHNARKNILS